MTDKQKPADYGVYSAVGQLRKVLLRAPGKARNRLTPANRDELSAD
ncbi:hypothetical protein [Acerihabitans arboris]|uniref:Uncharacterized protein n=1 Tax=Acerihabitans arboris TaxID=2691583 RepID=A0A845SI84_9GAMM|nr:hypothetical protein [Acerihabitans arboris]NDL64610.1 hypothetical protein [Acerihabitans arboris]